LQWRDGAGTLPPSPPRHYEVSMVFARFAFILFALLTIIYVCLWMYLCARQRRALEDEWIEQGGVAVGGQWKAFMNDRMTAFRAGLRRRMILGVYVLPVTALAIVIYVTNTD
jgi:cbb3-type cytochrome oxidase subunit 3